MLETTSITPELPSLLDPINQPYFWTTGTTPKGLQWPSRYKDKIFKQSHCELEADGWCSDILNRFQVPERLGMDFSAQDPKFNLGRLKETICLNPSSSATPNERLVRSMKRVWDDEALRRSNCGLPSLDPPFISPWYPNRSNQKWTGESKSMDELTRKIDDRLNAKLKQLNNREAFSTFSRKMKFPYFVFSFLVVYWVIFPDRLILVQLPPSLFCLFDF